MFNLVDGELLWSFIIAIKTFLILAKTVLALALYKYIRIYL
jgi:hypothetical protein